MGINYPLVIGDARIVRDFGGIRGLPTTFIIDRQGTIVQKHEGYVAESVFEREIKPLLLQEALPQDKTE